MMMGVRVLKILKRWAVLLAISAITLLAIRAYDSQRGQPLEPWHTYVPHELSVKATLKIAVDGNAVFRVQLLSDLGPHTLEDCILSL